MGRVGEGGRREARRGLLEGRIREKEEGEEKNVQERMINYKIITILIVAPFTTPSLLLVEHHYLNT